MNTPRKICTYICVYKHRHPGEQSSFLVDLSNTVFARCSLTFTFKYYKRQITEVVKLNSCPWGPGYVLSHHFSCCLPTKHDLNKSQICYLSSRTGLISKCAFFLYCQVKVRLNLYKKKWKFELICGVTTKGFDLIVQALLVGQFLP